MLQDLPELIYPVRLARAEQALYGHVTLARMRRLRPLLAVNAGYAEVDLWFGPDDLGYLSVQGKVRAELNLICQRCLSTILLRVESDMYLDMIASDDQMDCIKHISPGFEPLVVVDDDTAVALSDIIEDQLLLTLPTVPRHPDGVCDIAGRYLVDESTHSDRNKPFALLSGLMEHEEKGISGSPD
uniref:Large ribosomal RNA subunit accumulation protein YceD n=1 Tax=Candidatus Kentrum sp. LFY TaxID=2126342 RepID=A0A450WVY1_9GAMM|nr:MAG: uncharacterized protein BECKLFY1418C_GA0070996_108812 [Candidatus Kentron sp. LFY]